MAKKLIITEEQYSRLQSQLTESMDINATLKKAKIGDVLSFKGVNSILKVKVVNINPTNGDVIGDTEKGDKVTFNVNSYNQTTKMINFKIYDSNKQQFIDTPFQLNTIENLGGTANQTQQQPNNTQPEKDSEVGDDEYNYVPGTVYNAITKDPELRKLMHHTPWWDSFVSELMSKKAEGTGIINALNFFSSYQNEKLNKLLGDGFVVGKWAEFQVLDPVLLYFEGPNGKTEELEFNVMAEYRALNQPLNLRDRNYDYRVLKAPGKNGYKIYVKEKTNQENVFICDITKSFENKQGELKKNTKQNIRIKFILSEGYKPTNNQ
jgi:hypothetical protein